MQSCQKSKKKIFGIAKSVWRDICEENLNWKKRQTALRLTIRCDSRWFWDTYRFLPKGIVESMVWCNDCYLSFMENMQLWPSAKYFYKISLENEVNLKWQNIP